MALSADAVEDDARNGNLARGAGVFNAVVPTPPVVATCSVAAMQNQVWTGNLTVGTRMISSTTSHGWSDGGEFTGRV